MIKPGINSSTRKVKELEKTKGFNSTEMSPVPKRPNDIIDYPFILMPEEAFK